MLLQNSSEAVKQIKHDEQQIYESDTECISLFMALKQQQNKILVALV